MTVYGFFQRLVHIDLSRRTFSTTHLDPELLSRTLGGKGLAAHLLARSLPPGVDPLSEANRVIFALGPATDTLVWGSTRLGVFTKSPLTGCFNESYAGGRAAIPLSRTGFDAVDISGAADEPVWLEVSENGVLFHPAADLWGLDCYQADEVLRARAGDKAGVVVIGPAGENLVRFAVLATEKWHMAGRGGTGAVLGAKKVKGIVFTGKVRRRVARPDSLRTAARRLITEHNDQEGTRNYRQFGTPAMVDLMNTAGAFPSSYWSRGRMENWEQIGAENIRTALQTTPRSCPRCFLDCRKMARIGSGRHRGLRLEGPEYETVYAFGGLCAISDVNEVAFLNDLCDRLGLDTMSCGNLVGLVLEAAKRGRIQHPARYGCVEDVEALVRQVAAREGLGAVLALGIRRAAQQLGLKDLAVHVKGMEPAGYDPRVLKGMGLAYAVSARGACHLRASFHRAELTGLADPADPAGLVASFLEHEDLCTLMDCLIVCRFFRKIYAHSMSELFALTTGLDLDMTALRARAGRVTDLTRAINLRQGISAADDRLPDRLLRQPLPDGHSITPEEMQAMVGQYYAQRGWSVEGVPPETNRFFTESGDEAAQAAGSEVCTSFCSRE